MTAYTALTPQRTGVAVNGKDALNKTVLGLVKAVAKGAVYVSVYASKRNQRRHQIRRGDVVTGVIVHIDDEKLLVDIGLHENAVLPVPETQPQGAYSFDALHVNDKIPVYVLRPETYSSFFERLEPAELTLKRIKEPQAQQVISESEELDKKSTELKTNTFRTASRKSEEKTPMRSGIYDIEIKCSNCGTINHINITSNVELNREYCAGCNTRLFLKSDELDEQITGMSVPEDDTQTQPGIRCPDCGWVNPPEERLFCRQCGVPLEKREEYTADEDDTGLEEIYDDEEETTYAASPVPLSSVVLGRGINLKTDEEEKVTVGDVERRGGVYILGQPRTGKTTLLVNMIVQDSMHGHGICFIDPHGDAIEEVIKLLPEDRLDDVILLDPLDEEYAFGLNLFACQNPQSRKQVSRTINYVLQVFGKLFTESGDLQDAVTMYGTLLNTTILLVYNQSFTLAEVPLLLVNRDAAAKLIDNIGEAHDDEKEWWLEYNRMKFAEKNEVSGSTRRRLRTFLTDEHIRHIVGQSRSTLDFRAIMDTGKILLVKLPREFPELSKLVGSLIIGQLLTAAYSRDDTPEPDRRQFCLYCDEFQNFATPDFAELFTQTGKYHLAPTVAHQERVGQFAEEQKILGATSAAAIKISFQTTVKDAEELAPEYARPPEEAWEEELEPEWVEIVRPQKHERIEEQVEVEVEEDIMEISQNPVEYLKSARGTHGNPLVREATHTFLSIFATHKWNTEYEDELNRLLVDAMEGRVETGTVQLAERIERLLYKFFPLTYTPPESDRFLILTLWLKKEIDYLSEEYVWAKTQRVSSDEVNEQDVERLLCKDNFDNLFYDEINPERWGYPLLVSEKLHRLTELYDAVRRSMTVLLREIVMRSSSLSKAEKQLHDILSDYFLELARLHHFNTMEKKIRKTHNEEVYVNPHKDIETWNALGKYWLTKDWEQIEKKWELKLRSEEIMQVISQYKEAWHLTEEAVLAYVPVAINDVVSFTRTLLVLCEGLAADPIMVPTGKKRMVKRIQPHITYLTHESEKITHPRKTISHPKRTEADMVGQMRRELINLPRFTAYCKIVKAVAGKQVVVKYTLYPDAPESVADGAGSPDWKKAYIVARMHDETLGYYRKRETVEQEIAARRATLKAREPRQKGQTTSDEDEE